MDGFMQRAHKTETLENGPLGAVE